MSTIIYTELCKSLRVDDLERKPTQSMIRRKKQDPDVARAERRAARSEYRSNQCSVCFTAKSTNGSCNC